MRSCQRSLTLSQLVDYCLVFTNLEVNLCYLLLPGFLALVVFFIILLCLNSKKIKDPAESFVHTLQDHFLRFGTRN